MIRVLIEIVGEVDRPCSVDYVDSWDELPAFKARLREYGAVVVSAEEMTWQQQMAMAENPEM